MLHFTRRKMLQHLGTGLLATAAAPRLLATAGPGPVENPSDLYKIAFSSWCFHMPLLRGEMRATDLPPLARELGLDALEWTAKTFRDLKQGRQVMFQAPDATFFRELRRAADDAGVQSRVFNVGGPFFLAGFDESTRQKALDYILQYVEGAGLLGSDILRTELYYDGDHTAGWEQDALGRASEGLHSLLEATEDTGLTINVENHHGISSKPEWLAGLLDRIDSPRLGLTADTNNFRIDIDNPYASDPDSFPRYVDRYQGLQILMPHANWVSAKFYAFDNTGYEISMDYPRILDIILASGYSGYISVEYEGAGDPLEGVRSSVTMLEKLRTQLLELG